MDIRKILPVVGVVFLGLMIWLSASKRKESPTHSRMVKTATAASTETKAVEKKEDSTADKLYQQAAKLTEHGQLIKAKEAYQKIYMEYPEYDNIGSVQQELENLNMKMVFSNVESEHAISHDVVRGDTLGKLAKNYGTTIELIKINNNLDSDVIRIGQKLRVWTGKFNIFVDKSQNKLILKTGDDVIKVYNVSTGKNNSTPVGEFSVTSKLTDPVWFNKGIVVPPESPANVLGTRWLGFDIPGYGIHGTVEPDKIGQQVTAGCVRMRNLEVEELFSIIPYGTEVVITD